MKNILEKLLEKITYDNLNQWCFPQIGVFSQTKNLFPYQITALKNIISVLFSFYSKEHRDYKLSYLYANAGFVSDNFNLTKYQIKKNKRTNIVDKRFLLLQNYYKQTGYEGDPYIHGENFINRACFWMATGSGKSLVLIKTIEILDYLQSQGLIPKKEIMLLLPREDLIQQFKNEIADFNKQRDRKIELINLKRYEDEKRKFDFDNTIKVYYYRSDLLRDKRKEHILDYRSYQNNGDWYVFLDEAHRGDKEDSLMQDYVCILSRNGFLFNFSATFTDPIDYITTCFNFNLEKFIIDGYGKNLYLSPSYFKFDKSKEDFNERDKQKQVLKSLICFSIIKLNKINEHYHHPLLITLVNSVNTKDSDLMLFFKKLEEIATGKIELTLFEQAKKELIKDFETHTSYVFGKDILKFDMSTLCSLSIDDVLKQVFNSDKTGKIEIIEGEKGKELALKLETSEKAFALIKIGDTNKFKKDQLGSAYTFVSSYDSKKFFSQINQNEDINLLLGSRSFYEGWDSNRPNVINMINIGKKDAKKFVLQGIGRGIRIEPHKGERKRLQNDNKYKNVLLESLFVFATDKNAVKAIIETVENERNTEETEISLFKNEEIQFDLLVPVYKDEEEKRRISRFNIAQSSLINFKNYLQPLDINTILLKSNISFADLNFFKNELDNDGFFQIRPENEYKNMDILLNKVINHVSVKNKYVSEIKEMKEEIIHFKHIKVRFTDEEVKSFIDKLEKVKNFLPVDKKEIALKFATGQIDENEFNKQITATPQESFKTLTIKKIAEHYYLPVIYSETEKADYIKHIINVPSEVQFVKNLESYLKSNKPDCQWMFSKIDQTLDSFHIPYFSKKDNIYRKFFPDFIFWLKNNNDYKIIFVDPKGTNNTEYQNKADGFERLFMENGQAKTFKYKSFNIHFELKLIAKDLNSVSNKYEHFWLGQNDFSFIKI